MYEIKSGRIKPKKESTFGKVKKPFKGKAKNRKGSKKESMFNHTRIKEKPSMKNESKFSDEDAEYMEYLKLQDALCFCCGRQRGIEWHHVKEFSNDAKDHNILIPLCGVECHRLGTELSAHGTPKKFREEFPIEKQREVGKAWHEKYLREMS